MNDACGERRIALGAYVLGALDPPERDELEDHLAGCADCRAELAALVAMPAALGRLSTVEALAAGEGRRATAGAAHASTPSVLERALAELARRRRSARLRWRVAAASGTVAVLALGVAVGVLVATRPASTAPATVAARFSGSDSSTGVSASAALYTEPWGSSIHLDVAGVTPGDQCELVAIGRDGSQQVAGAWSVGYTGGVAITGSTGISPSQVASLEVVTTSGSALVDLQG
jgi:anti-sigma factor RsiW